MYSFSHCDINDFNDFSWELTGYFIKIRFAHFIQRYSGVRVVKIIFSPRWEVPSNNL